MSLHEDIFSGNNAPSPQEIRDALGWMDHDEQASRKLIGAVMSLCNRVSALEARLAKAEGRTDAR